MFRVSALIQLRSIIAKWSAEYQNSWQDWHGLAAFPDFRPHRRACHKLKQMLSQAAWNSSTHQPEVVDLSELLMLATLLS